MAAFDQEQYNQALEDLDEDHQRVDVSPTKNQLLGPWTIVCLVLNRTIGSGIFTVPSRILSATGSVGASLLLWTFGGIAALCGLLCWLEIGLSVPLHRVPGTNQRKSVPRSGGEKNYLEFIFRKPKFVMTCVYGILFIVLGNLSGNAVAFGIYVMDAAGIDDPSRGAVYGIAIGALTLCALLHTFSRRGGIVVNNVFAIVKVAMLVTIIVLGFVKAGNGLKDKGAPRATDNFKTSTSFKSNRHDISSYANAFLYVFYTYSGFEQPFYVLSEIQSPRKTFPKYTTIAMLIALVLFVLVNISYFCVVPADVYTSIPPKTLNNNIGAIFFTNLFGSEDAQRAMSALIATSIFGNILVMTFTAARVKQEIAKEGILPFSLVFATGHTTPLAWLKARWQSRSSKPAQEAIDDHLEQSPIAALGLHWLSSVTLIAVTSMLEPQTSYSFLVSLYSYVIVVLLGFLVAGGLLYLKLDKSREWSTICNFKPLLDPVPAIVFFVFTGFLLFASCAKPAADSPYSYKNLSYQWFLIPAIGLTSVFWGLIWWGGLQGVMRYRRKELIVTRLPLIVQDEEDETQWVQKAELVDHEWQVVVGSGRGSMEEYELN